MTIERSALRLLVYLTFFLAPAIVSLRLFPIAPDPAATSGDALGLLNIYVEPSTPGRLSEMPDVYLRREPYGFWLLIRNSPSTPGHQPARVRLRAEGAMSDALRSCDLRVYEGAQMTLDSPVRRLGRLSDAELPGSPRADAAGGPDGTPAPPTSAQTFTAQVLTGMQAESAVLDCHTPDGLVARDDGGNLYFYVPRTSILPTDSSRLREPSVSDGCISVDVGPLAPDATVTFEDPAPTSVDGPHRSWNSCSGGTLDPTTPRDEFASDHALEPITAQYASIEGSRRESRATFVAGVLLGASAGAAIPAYEATEQFVASLRSRRSRAPEDESDQLEEPAPPDCDRPDVSAPQVPEGAESHQYRETRADHYAGTLAQAAVVVGAVVLLRSRRRRRR
jgi:hypothetical protein